MIPPLLGVEGPTEQSHEKSPRRAVASINVRHEDRRGFDALQAWWSAEEGRVLSQWDTFERVMSLVRAHAKGLPREVRRFLE